MGMRIGRTRTEQKGRYETQWSRGGEACSRKLSKVCYMWGRDDNSVERLLETETINQSVTEVVSGDDCSGVLDEG